MTWYSATCGVFIYGALLIFYLLRRRRLIFDLDEHTWTKFQAIGEVFLVGYLFHYIPYFFVDRTLFLHHYLPAFVFKTCLLSAVMEHVYLVVKNNLKAVVLSKLMILMQLIWLCTIIYVYSKFSVLSYGTTELTMKDILDLRWKDTWDFIIHRK